MSVAWNENYSAATSTLNRRSGVASRVATRRIILSKVCSLSPRGLRNHVGQEIHFTDVKGFLVIPDQEWLREGFILFGLASGGLSEGTEPESQTTCARRWVKFDSLRWTGNPFTVSW
jgi:hypothetical protein